MAVVACGLIIDLLALVVCAWAAYSSIPTTIIAGAVNSIAWIGGYWLFTRWRGLRPIRARFASVPLKVILASLTLPVAAVVFFSFVRLLLVHWGLSIPTIRPFVLEHASKLEVAALIGLVVLLAPVAEELMFRGLLIDWLLKRLRSPAVIVISSVLFVLVHRDPLLTASGIVAAYRLSMGATSAYFRLRYNSLLPSSVLHVTSNALAMAVLGLSG